MTLVAFCHATPYVSICVRIASELNAGWVPNLDGHASFGRMPLVEKELDWFERTGFFRQQSFETCPMWGGSTF